MLTHISDITEGQSVLIRASLNAPTEPEDDERLRQSARTIQYCLKKKARVTIIGHQGDGTESLSSIHTRLLRYVPHTFVHNIVGKEAVHARKKCKNGEAVLLENTRSDKREEQNDQTYASELLDTAEIVVFDAFSVAHRTHASTNTLLTQAPVVCIGLRFKEEIEALKTMLEPSTGALVVIGGAKLATKVPLLQSLLKTYSNVAVGGVLANTLFALRGFEVGISTVENMEGVSGIEDLINNNKIILPEQVVVSKKGEQRITTPDDIGRDESIQDVYIVETLSSVCGTPTSIVWNGPLGNSTQGFVGGSAEMGDYLASLPDTPCIVGGGDTLSCLEDDIKNQLSFISTGGGAMLHYLTHSTLPVLHVLNV